MNNSNTFAVTVRSSWSEDKTFHVSPSDLVESIKIMLQGATGVSAARISLSYHMDQHSDNTEAVALEDGHSLSEYRISAAGVVTAEYKVIKVRVRNLSGKSSLYIDHSFDCVCSSCSCNIYNIISSFTCLHLYVSVFFNRNELQLLRVSRRDNCYVQGHINEPNQYYTNKYSFSF